MLLKRAATLGILVVCTSCYVVIITTSSLGNLTMPQEPVSKPPDVAHEKPAELPMEPPINSKAQFSPLLPVSPASPDLPVPKPGAHSTPLGKITPIGLQPEPSRDIGPFQAITKAEASNALKWNLPKALVGGDLNSGMWGGGSDSCDETGGDLQFVRHMSRYENRITICDDGPTVVECLLDSKDGYPTKGKGKRAPKNSLDPIVRFCFARNLYPPKIDDRLRCLSNDHNERDGCSWTMYCRPAGFWKEQGGGVNAPMFRGLGNAFNWIASGTLRREDPETAPTKVGDTDSDESEGVLHYIAFGDCGGRWNPGHCMADPINFSAVQKILGYDNTNTYSYLLRGLNYDNLAKTDGDKTRPMFELWEALSKRAFPRIESYDAFPRHGPVSLVAFSPAPTTSAW